MGNRDASVVLTASPPVSALTEADISARIERLPLSGFHARAVGVVGLAHFFDAFDALTIAFVLPVLIPLWGMTPTQAGFAISIGYLGQTIGSIGMSALAERVGRLRAIAWSVAIISLFSLATSFAAGFASFAALRFAQGIGLGGESPAAATYINEMCPAALRGRLVFVLQSLFALATAATALVALWIIPRFGWQAMYYIGSAPIVLALLIRRLIPESPRWLAARGRLDEARDIVDRMERAAYRNGPPPTVPTVSGEPGKPVRRAGAGVLFAPGYRVRTLSLWTMAFCTSITGYGILAWMPTVYTTVLHLPVNEALRFGAVGNVAALAGAFCGIFLIDRLGRRRMFMLGFAGGGVPLLALWWLGAYTATSNVVTLAAASVFFMTFMLVGIYVYAPEIYPTRVRALGAGLASAWMRVATIIGPIVVGHILAGAGVATVFLFLGVAAFLGCATVMLFAIETRGRPLDAIAH